MTLATLAPWPPADLPPTPAYRLSDLSHREREVLGLMAIGRSNVGIARDLLVSEGAIEKHVANIFSKLGLVRAPGAHRRVLTVIAYLTDR